MSKQAKKLNKLSTAPQYVRVLAGSWRGSKLPVVLNEDLRPTPNRVRETLFNWLQAYIAGSDCLDLFAGSGALGFEAMSRGARSATLVDADPQVKRVLQQQVEKLQAKQIDVVCRDAISYLNQTEAQFDIIFLDPPFAKFDPFEIAQIIQTNNLLKPNGLIYVEFAKQQDEVEIPLGWQWKRQSQAAEVQYGLLTLRTTT